MRAKVVVLAASALETRAAAAELEVAAVPAGARERSGTVGRYITDTTGTDVSGFIPAMVDHVPHNEDGVGGMHVYMPWWLDNRKLDFPRGYHIEVWGGLGQPSYGFMGGIQRYPNVARLRREAQGRLPPTTTAHDRLLGPRRDDPERQVVTPRSIRRSSTSGASRCCGSTGSGATTRCNQSKHMQETFRALIAEMGGTAFSDMPTKEQGYGLAPGGRIIHELGGARMGSRPEDVGAERSCQAHDVKNLFVADGAPFVSQADKNPTWTILALAWRTADAITSQRKAGAI